MLSEKNKNLKLNASSHELNNLNDFVIKIDYYDNKGKKNIENHIPLKYLFNSNTNLFNKNTNTHYI